MGESALYFRVTFLKVTTFHLGVTLGNEDILLLYEPLLRNIKTIQDLLITSLRMTLRSSLSPDLTACRAAAQLRHGAANTAMGTVSFNHKWKSSSWQRSAAVGPRTV